MVLSVCCVLLVSELDGLCPPLYLPNLDSLHPPLYISNLDGLCPPLYIFALLLWLPLLAFHPHVICLGPDVPSLVGQTSLLSVKATGFD